MLGLLLLYFVGKKFYELAKQYKRSPWVYAILSIVVYYGMVLVSAFLIGIILGLNGVEITSGVEVGFSLVSVVIGAVSVWGFYKILSSAWSKKPIYSDQIDLLDQE